MLDRMNHIIHFPVIVTARLFDFPAKPHLSLSLRQPQRQFLPHVLYARLRSQLRHARSYHKLEEVNEAFAHSSDEVVGLAAVLLVGLVVLFAVLFAVGFLHDVGHFFG